MLNERFMSWSESIKGFIIVLGDFSLFCLDILRSLGRIFRRRNIFFFQCLFIGVISLWVI